jgi:hypothetical protein
MSFKGINKKCQQCLGECKQLAKATVMHCSHFQSNQKKNKSTPLAMEETTGMTSEARFFESEHNP